MITRAGRLSSTISQGSPNRSASRDRPMTRPITEPSAMARVNATATRASVAPRLKASAPERASSTMASATACGIRKQARAGQLRAGVPGRDEQNEGDEPRAQIHSPAAGR